MHFQGLMRLEFVLFELHSDDDFDLFNTREPFYIEQF